ncbi:MAG TPA: YXWGXW repeat-containing protein [Terracidiphilus sp.]
MRQVLRIALLVLVALPLFRPVAAQVSITVTFAPPALPIYEQPPCPDEGFLWIPGYWAWDSDDYDYYWVPGTWVPAPAPGLLWTPPWWGWDGGLFVFHEGFWAIDVGFYGGIVYGFGYFGHGFEGGRWENGHFFYNRAVMNVNVVNIHNVYNQTVVNNVTVVNHVSYNGGEGGIQERPTLRELAVEHQRHLPPVPAQMQHVQRARSNPQLRASANQGKPPVAATVRPGQLRGHGAVPARAASVPYHPPPSRPATGGTKALPGQNPSPTLARELRPHLAPPAQGNTAADLTYQREQQKLIEEQNNEHLKLQRQQEREDQQAAAQEWNQQRRQQMEQRQQHQTQQMEQRHAQQLQQLITRQNARRPH